jgi:hypothetical protein
MAVRAVGVRENKKKVNMRSSGNCVFHTYGGADPTEPIIIFFTSRDLADVINCAKFNIDRSRVTVWRGSKKSHVLIGKRSCPQHCIALPFML